MRRRLHRVLCILGCLLVLLGLGYAGLFRYLTWREQVSPSTRQVLVLKNGREIPLLQPTSAPRPATQAVELSNERRAEPSAAPTATPTAPPLPPKRIKIPKIEVDWPVVLSDNDHLPRFRGVGWLMGSAFPGAPGNLVLFGHLGGPYGTFMRLHELEAGDEFSVLIDQGERRYRVRSSRETTPDDVAVLAPTDTATATLITCSGPWDSVRQTNERRLIVTADYIGQPEGVAP